DRRNGVDYDLYAGRVSGAGAIVWGAGGVAVAIAAGNVVGADLVIDGFGGAIAAWDDNRAASDIYARRFDNTGAPLWTDGGVPACLDIDQQENPSMVADGAGGAIIAWEELLAGTSDIYAQRVDGAGEPA